MAHAYTNLSGLSSVIICDKEYPSRVAFALINRILDEFAAAFPRDVWLTTPSRLDFPQLREMLVKYQNPHEADPIMRVQRELDETKVILVGTLWTVLHPFYSSLISCIAQNHEFPPGAGRKVR